MGGVEVTVKKIYEVSPFGTWLDSMQPRNILRKLEVGKSFSWLGGPAGVDLEREREIWRSVNSDCAGRKRVGRNRERGKNVTIHPQQYLLSRSSTPQKF